MTPNPFARAPGRPRDPARIDIVLSALRAYWIANPDLRLGQIVVNAAGTRNPYNVEDDVLTAGWPDPARAPRTCWTCRHASPDSRECRFNGSRTTDSHRSTWCAATGNLDPDTDMPLPTATPCPAFAERP